MRNKVLIACLLAGIAGASAAAAADQNVYHCRWMSDPPARTVRHWSRVWSRAKRGGDYDRIASRFLPYGASAQQLETDPSVIRAYDPAAALSKPRATSFLMGYCDQGWHLYIQTEEPLIGRIMDAPEPARESMEIFFTTDRHHRHYHQIMVNLAAGTVEEYALKHRQDGYRPLGNALRGEVDVLPDGSGWGTYLFVPWLNLYDRLPFDDTVWQFSIMRWMPFSRSGGVTWGGKVHEAGAWGHVGWERPAPEHLVEIRRTIIRDAWQTYRKQRDDLERYWGAQCPDFFRNSLQPLIQQIETDAAAVDALATLDDHAVMALFDRVADWMNFDARVDQLRGDDLRDTFFANP